MSIDIPILISIISVTIAVSSFFLNNRRADTKDIETRVAHDTKVDMKLDAISNTVNDIKYDVTSLRKYQHEMAERITVIEKSVEKCHLRVDALDEKVEGIKA